MNLEFVTKLLVVFRHSCESRNPVVFMLVLTKPVLSRVEGVGKSYFGFCYSSLKTLTKRSLAIE